MRLHTCIFSMLSVYTGQNSLFFEAIWLQKVFVLCGDQDEIETSLCCKNEKLVLGHIYMTPMILKCRMSERCTFMSIFRESVKKILNEILFSLMFFANF